MIYGQFEKVIRNKYLASEDYLQLLAEKIPESKLLKNIQVFIDGFHSFTPQEYAVIEALLKHAGQVTVALTVDYPYRSFMPDDYHLFRMPGETYAMLFEIAEINGIPVEGDLVLHEQHRFNHPSLRHLEQTFEKLPAEPFEGDPNIYICEASNLRAEIEGVGRKLSALSGIRTCVTKILLYLSAIVLDTTNCLRQFLQIIKFLIISIKSDRCLIIH